MNRILLIIILLSLLLPLNVSMADETDGISNQLEQVETSVIENSTESNVESQDSDDLEDNTLENDQNLQNVVENDIYKQPVSKRKLVKKFLAAMGGVAASSFALFFILTVYNKARERYLNPVKTIDGENTLESPDNINSAVKTFLDKTDWS